MKKVLLAGFLLFSFQVTYAQATEVISVINQDDEFFEIAPLTTLIIVENQPAATPPNGWELDLSSAEQLGRRLTIVNYAPFNLRLAQTVRRNGPPTQVMDTVFKSPNEFSPFGVPVVLHIVYDGYSWIEI